MATSGLVVILTIVGILVVLVLLLLCCYLANWAYIVHQGEGIVIEKFGKFDQILDPGFHKLIPFYQKPRTFSWHRVEIDPSGHVVSRNIHGYRIDTRENVFNFMRQEFYTKDTVLLDINFLMYYRIWDIQKAMYENPDLASALSGTAQTQIKEVIGTLTFNETLQGQHTINENLQREFYSLFRDWGVETIRMEILSLKPNEKIEMEMKKQMMAERNRRGNFIRSEGKKVASKLEGEGKKLVEMNIGLAGQEATKKVSKGEATALIEKSQAEAQSLEIVHNALKADNVKRSEYLLALKTIGMIGSIYSNKGSKTIYLPYNLDLIKGMLGDVQKIYGSESENKNVVFKDKAPTVNITEKKEDEDMKGLD